MIRKRPVLLIRRVFLSHERDKAVPTLETGIFANFEVKKSAVPTWRVRQAHTTRK